MDVNLAVDNCVFDRVLFYTVLFPKRCLGAIWDCIEPVSENFPIQSIRLIKCSLYKYIIFYGFVNCVYAGVKCLPVFYQSRSYIKFWSFETVDFIRRV